jgi:molybdopterin synthase catalytic subunit
MAERTLIRVSPEVLDPADALAFVADPAAGGTCLFVGTVRDHSEAGAVEGITYEAWPELAERRLAEVAAEMHLTWALSRVALLHRFGDLDVTEVSVAVAASAAHREEAFAACRHGIERLKQEVPIWKKERLADGESSWVMGS